MADNQDTLFRWAGLIFPIVATAAWAYYISQKKAVADRNDEFERHRVANEVQLDTIRTNDMAALRSETKDIIMRLREDLAFYREEVRKMRVEHIAEVKELQSAHQECQRENAELHLKVEVLEDKVCELERRIDL